MRAAVIGGGFSGLLTAYSLQKKGVDVTLYEKEGSVGGHCRTMNSQGIPWELGTVVAFSNAIKPLLIELQIDYREKYTSRNFLDGRFNHVELVPPTQIQRFLEEMNRLADLYRVYSPYLSPATYSTIHQDLMIPLYDFLEMHHLPIVRDIIAPHLSAYGFGSIYETQTYYAFKSFSEETLQTFTKGDRLLYVEGGFSELIHGLSRHIMDIRYGQPVIRIEEIHDKVQVSTALSTDVFDHVFISTKLPDNVIQPGPYKHWMSHIQTNPYFSCAYEINNRHAVATYFKANLGIEGKVQFFHTTRQQNCSILVAYAYGTMTGEMIHGVEEDLVRAGMEIKHLIAAKQWQIFPHMNKEKLRSDSYEKVIDSGGPIHFTGALICQPSLSKLYRAVMDTVDRVVVMD